MKGLNYATAPKQIPIEQYIVGLLHATTNRSRKLTSRHDHSTIIILPTDKGRAKVVMDITQYEKKIGEMLDDEKTYSILKSDPTAKII